MNLTMVGTIDASLPQAIAAIVGSRGTRLDEAAIRFVDVDHSAPTRRDVSALCASARVDHAFLEAGTRLDDFRLFVTDMDSTLITIECIDEMADFAGKKTEVAAITEATMRGEITNFTESLKRRVALLSGMDASLLERVYRERLRLSNGAIKLISAARHAGLYCLLVSGGFTFFSERLKQDLHFDDARANVLEIVNGKLTGNVLGVVVDADAKAEAVRTAIDKLGCEPNEVIVVGDGANDMKMMTSGRLSVAYHAKPVVKAHARASIDFGGLDVLLRYVTL